MALAPPIEPMLAKLADELPPAGAYLYEPKWDGFRAIVFRGASDVYIQSRDSRPLDRYFPELHDALLERLPKNCVVDGEIVIATGKRAGFRCAAAPAAPGGVARRQAGEGNALLVRRFRPAGERQARPDGHAARRAPRAARAAARQGEATGLPDAGDARPRHRARLADALRRRGARRRDREARVEPLPARQARDDQGEARAHRGMRGRRVPLAQERQGRASARCSSGCTTTRACCSTWASPPRSPWRCASSS